LFAQQLSPKGLFLAKQAGQEMRRADLFVLHAFGFFVWVDQHSLGSWLSGRSTDVAVLGPVLPRCSME
jgi:hypothetical protein